MSIDIYPVLFILDLHMKYTVELVALCTYIVICYCMIAAPCVRSVGCVFVYLYTLDDNSERPMNYETSLLPKGYSMEGPESYS